MLKPSQRKSKVIQVCLRPSEYEHLQFYLETMGLDCRDLLLQVSHFHQLTKHQLQKEGE